MEAELVPFDDYISEESDFHGTAKTRKKLQSRSEKVSMIQLVRAWNQSRASRPTSSTVAPEVVAPQALHNRFEGLATARQLTETVDEFLERLPPRTTITESWIWVTCPIVKDKKDEPRHVPESEESPSHMMELANALLGQFNEEKQRIESDFPNAAQSTITRKLTPLRDQLKEDILDLAVTSGVTNGKWMLFPKPEDVNRIWKLVAEAVIDGRLGDTAKVAPANPPNPSTGRQKQSSHLICVYTQDFSDLDDVRRVLQELIELGLAPRNATDGAIYYKTDVYTYLNIDSANPFGLKASLYCSKDLMGLSKKSSKTPIARKRSSDRKQQSLTDVSGTGKRKRM